MAQPVARDIMLQGSFSGYLYQNTHESSTNWRDWGFTFNPVGGIFLTDHWLIQGSARYRFDRDFNFDTNQGSRRHTLGLGVGTSYYFGQEELRPFVFTSILVAHQHFVRTNGSVTTPETNHFNHYTHLGAGLSYWFTRNMAVSGRTYLEGVGGFYRPGFGSIHWHNTVGFQFLIDRENPFRCP